MIDSNNPKLRDMMSLCRIAARLGVPVVTVQPDAWEAARWNASGIFFSHGSKKARAALREFGISCDPPVIVLNPGNARDPWTLAHEIGHVAAQFSDYIDARMNSDYPRNGLLARVAARHGISGYCRSTRIELRAECIRRRLLGETLPPVLRRFTERAYQDLLWKCGR